MYTLQDTWIWAYGKSRYKGWNGRFLCIETDKETTFLTNTLPGTLAAYGFTIVLNSSFTALYSGREISIERNHLLITMPGFHLKILAVSDDYSGLCLVADESYALEAPSTRTAVRTAGEYLASDTSLREELLGNLYSLFLTDVSSILLRRSQHVKMGKRAEELFMDFMQMLPQHDLHPKSWTQKRQRQSCLFQCPGREHFCY